MKSELTQARLKELLNYDPETGEFTWRGSGSGRKKSSAGHKAAKGYLAIGLLGKTYKAHRVAWMYAYGCWPNGQIDHKDLDRTNNKLQNLREVDPSMNKQNVGVARVDNKCGVLGVSDRGDRFVARLTVRGECVHLGSFSNAYEAHAAYLEAKVMHHPGHLPHPTHGGQ